jgi:hypothetical protein
MKLALVSSFTASAIAATLAVLAAAACSSQAEIVGTSSQDLTTITFYTCRSTTSDCTSATAASSMAACTQTPGCKWTYPGNGCFLSANCAHWAPPCTVPDAGGACALVDGKCEPAIVCPTSSDTTESTCLAVAGCLWGPISLDCEGSDPSQCACQAPQPAQCPTGPLKSADECTSAGPTCVATEHQIVGGCPSGNCGR